MTGTVLDKYEILQKLGEGGMATVYRGRHLTLGRDVAIKILHPHLSASTRNRLRFAREARAIEHLDHDNILKIFDYSGTDAEDCFIVTEFVDGVTLHQVLTEHGHLPCEVAALIASKLASALQYAHKAGIIHRDLKPENVMVRRDGTVKLMDFGIARFLDEANVTMTGALVGSPAYMSPEQAMEHVLDTRSDLFSLGTVLYHLVTGQLPFSGGNPSIILRNIIDGNRPEVLELAPDMSGAMADLIEKLLQTDPAGRPSSAGEVRDSLNLALADVGIDPTSPSWCLRAWLIDAKEYEARLTKQLSVTLLEQGKAMIECGDHLGALRLLNRLLSMEEDNPEVLALVQGMHNPPAPARSRPPVWVWVGAATLLLGGAALAWQVTRPGRDPASAARASASVPSPNAAVAGVRAEPENLEYSDIDLPQSPIDTEPALATPSPTGALPDGSSPTSPAPVVALVEPAVHTRRTAQTLTTPEPAPAPAGRITVLVPGTWANIIVDDVEKGMTGRIDWPMEVSAGTHTLRVENDLAMPWTTTFTIAPGEVRTIEVTNLLRKPASLRFDPSLPGDCDVAVDGVDRGTLAGLGHGYQLREPEGHHEVTLRCDGTPEQRWVLDKLLPGAVRPLGRTP